MGWLTENEEGQKMGKIIEGILMFFRCCIFIGVGLVVLIQFRPQIQDGLRSIQALIF